MRHADNSDLLTPSLQDDSAAAVYSVGALIAAAFFGGGIAVVMMGTLNAQRLSRLGRDSIWLILMLLLSIGAVVFAIELDVSESGRSLRAVVSRGLGFALCGVLYVMHRRAFKAMTVLGLDPPSPYKPVIVACIMSFAVTSVIIRLMGMDL
ncbi:MAG: hypothetical protein AAGH76_00450 [Pseudomonadota bacterium]